jgi:hypothetical protein
MEFRNKNDYSIVVFFQDNTNPLKMEFVHNCYASSQWLTNSKNYNNWNYFNVYARRTKRFIKRFYRNNFIEAKPK